MEVLTEMQTGALSVADKEALGAKVLRHLDMEHFRDCLKRSYHAKATIEEARRQNLANHAAGAKRALDLKLNRGCKSAWSERARTSLPRMRGSRTPWRLMETLSLRSTRR